MTTPASVVNDYNSGACHGAPSGRSAGRARGTHQPCYVAQIEADAASLALGKGIKLLAGIPAELYMQGEER